MRAKALVVVQGKVKELKKIPTLVWVRVNHCCLLSGASSPGSKTSLRKSPTRYSDKS